MIRPLHPVAIARREAGLSQQQLAAKLGWSRMSVAFIENGTSSRVYVDNLIAIADALGIADWTSLASDRNKQPQRKKFHHRCK